MPYGVFWCRFNYEKRRGRESNPRIAVLQTATLPLGYPAGFFVDGIIGSMEFVSTWIAVAQTAISDY
jgi:hypothetical protein